VPVDVSPEVLALIDGLMADLGREAEGVAAAERIRDGFEVAIVGAPNAGKSTLLNQLAGREAAITSDIAGTTRDVIEVRMEIAGLPVTFLDTAGLRETDDRLEQAGIDRALARAEAADLRLFLTTGEPLVGLQPKDEDLVVQGKSDTIDGVSGLAVSGLTGDRVPELMARIGEILQARVGPAGALVRERHRLAVSDAIAALAESRAEVVRDDSRVELAAEHLRRAVTALDALIGRVDVDDLLGEIFASFCIGK
jgi:tRNA modification GTPase